MKKTTLLFALVFASSAIFAKGGQPSENAGGSSIKMTPFNSNSHSAARIAPSSNHSNAAFYSEDFSGGAIPAGWTNVDASTAAGGRVWTYTLIGAKSTEALSPTGTTAGNGYIMFDSDSSGVSVGGEDAILTTAAINCTGHTTVRLALNEFFRQYVASTGTISISNNGTTWTPIHQAEAGLTTAIPATSNPKAIDLDVTMYAANQATVYLRFEYVGDWDYYWMIDDIQLYEASAQDAGIAKISTNFNGCSLSATEPVTVLIKNYGFNAITNFNVSYVTTSSPAVTEVYTGSIAPFDTASYTFTQTADFSAPNFYGIQSYTGLTGDGLNSNDTSVSATSSYSHVDLTLGAYTQGFEPTDDYSGYTSEDIDADGVGFDVSTAYPHNGAQCIRKAGSGVADDDWLYSTCIDIGSTGTYALSYWYKNFELAAPCSLEVYMGTSNSSASMTNLIVQSPIPGDTTYQQTVANIAVPAGTYYVGFHFYSAAGSSSLRLDDINIDFNNAVNNISTSTINVYPNPSNGKINVVNTDKNVKDYSVVVYNSLGAVVYSQQFTNLTNEQIDLGNQPSGIYSVQLKSAKNTINKSIVIANN